MCISSCARIGSIWSVEQRCRSCSGSSNTGRNSPNTAGPIGSLVALSRTRPRTPSCRRSFSVRSSSTSSVAVVARQTIRHTRTHCTATTAANTSTPNIHTVAKMVHAGCNDCDSVSSGRNVCGDTSSVAAGPAAHAGSCRRSSANIPSSINLPSTENRGFVFSITLGGCGFVSSTTFVSFSATGAVSTRNNAQLNTPAGLLHSGGVRHLMTTSNQSM